MVHLCPRSWGEEDLASMVRACEEHRSQLWTLHEADVLALALFVGESIARKREHVFVLFEEKSPLPPKSKLPPIFPYPEKTKAVKKAND